MSKYEKNEIYIFLSNENFDTNICLKFIFNDSYKKFDDMTERKYITNFQHAFIIQYFFNNPLFSNTVFISKIRNKYLYKYIKLMIYHMHKFYSHLLTNKIINFILFFIWIAPFHISFDLYKKMKS